MKLTCLSRTKWFTRVNRNSSIGNPNKERDGDDATVFQWEFARNHCWSKSNTQFMAQQDVKYIR